MQETLSRIFTINTISKIKNKSELVFSYPVNLVNLANPAHDLTNKVIHVTIVINLWIGVPSWALQAHVPIRPYGTGRCRLQVIPVKRQERQTVKRLVMRNVVLTFQHLVGGASSTVESTCQTWLAEHRARGTENRHTSQNSIARELGESRQKNPHASACGSMSIN